MPARRLVRTVRAAAAGYSRHACSQFAAAIAYRVLFSLVPFLALVAAILDLVLPEAAREEVVEWLFGVIPGTEVEESVDRTLAGSDVSASVAGIVAFVVLLWSASGMMTSLRVALRVVWEAGAGPSFVRGKLLELALVGGAGVLLVLAFGLSVLGQVVAETGSDLADLVDWRGEGRILGVALQIGTSLLLTFLAVLLLYRLLPLVPIRVADVWPGALAATLGCHVASAGFGIYLAHVSDLSTVYGPLGAVLALLSLVYVLAAVVLFGAELAALAQTEPG